MKTNTSLLVIIGIVIIGGVFAIVGGKNENEVKQTKSTSVLSSARESHDFGEIDIYGGKVTTEFTLTNNGTDEIIITKGTTSCGCTDGEIAGISFGMHRNMRDTVTIPAGESENLKVIFDPLAHGPSGVGLAQRSVFLKTNSTATPEIEVQIKAMVTKNN